MRKQVITNKIIVAAIIIFYAITFQSCISFQKIIEENDIVYSTKRFSYRHISRNYKSRIPFLCLDQTIVKEINADRNESYHVYDVLTLASRSFRLEDKVFLITDNNVSQITIDGKEFEFSKVISENKSDMMTADSTKVSVVTGYSENNTKITRFTYDLSNENINEIKNANQVMFRYYAGPNMITVRLKKKELKKVKQLINSN